MGMILWDSQIPLEILSRTNICDIEYKIDNIYGNANLW